MFSKIALYALLLAPAAAISSVFKRQSDLDAFITAERAISLQGALANIGSTVRLYAVAVNVPTTTDKKLAGIVGTWGGPRNRNCKSFHGQSGLLLHMDARLGFDIHNAY